MGKTIAEKILSQHSKKSLKEGEIGICNVDFCFSQDGTSNLVIDNFNNLSNDGVFDNKKFAMFVDHSSPSPNKEISQIHGRMREFAKDKNIKLYDIGSGISHQIIFEKGFAFPGSLVCGADSHTLTCGVLNAFCTGMGSTDISLILASGKNWFRVPESIKIELYGSLPMGVYAKDVILNIIGKLGQDGATSKSIEFKGETIDSFSLNDRLCLANMTAEMGAETCIMDADSKVMQHFERILYKKIEPVFSDSDAEYIQTLEINVSNLIPQVAKPHRVDNVFNIDKVEGTRIDQAYIGTCTNGRLEDLIETARILKGRNINPDIRLIVSCASKKVYIGAFKKGVIEDIIQAGGVIIPPGCGPCVGTHAGIPADGEVVISTANRNFKGRMGNPNAFIYLASPATVAASCIEGKITDPRKYL